MGGEQAAGVLAQVKRDQKERSGESWSSEEERAFKQPVIDTYETTAPSAAATATQKAQGENISRGYREEMEHFCHCIRTGKDELRCNGTVAMADAIMALTANIAMKQQKRIEFKDEWFDPDSDACPEVDNGVERA
jgi:predicted dehydrogenase